MDQKTTLSHLLNKVIKDSIRSVEVAVQNNQDSFSDIRLLKHLKRKGKTFEEQKCNSSIVSMKPFLVL